MFFYLVLALFGGLAGVTTVLFGFGGGFVVVPLLYTALIAANGAESPTGQIAMQIAVATSTCVMIFGAALATRRHYLAGTLDWRQIRPLVAPIAVGSLLGAGAAMLVQGQWLRWAFVVYLGLTILDCLFRPGFMSTAAPAGRRISTVANTLTGIVIGSIAACLGVGGSVMTVPLMRRRGVPMTQATAMANPLSLPVALAGTATFVLFGWDHASALGSWHAGYVDVRAFLVLVIGSWLGIRLGARFIGRIPDAVHARVYLILLSLVLIAMVVRVS